MHIEKLMLTNFKNYEEVSIVLHNKVNCFVGDNGVGKTNLLDAVYYLCMCKSYFQSSDQFSIKYGSDYMTLQGIIEHNDQTDEIYCALKAGKKKQFRKNKKEYPKLSKHIGQYPVVMISPADSTLITEGSEERRKYINAVISQYDNTYLEDTIQYNHVLAQRNRLLKEMSYHSGSQELISIYNDQLIPPGNRIFEQRKDFIKQLAPIFKEYYSLISQGKEEVNIIYNSQLTDGNFEQLLNDSYQKDLSNQFSTTGIHKDDLELTMQGIPIRKTGSQGQQKTFLVALKMAQFRFLKELKGVPPFLLLDDIFDKFDTKRVKQILNIVSDNSFGQIFITHTNEIRMKELLLEFHGNYNLYRVENGNIIIV